MPLGGPDNAVLKEVCQIATTSMIMKIKPYQKVKASDWQLQCPLQALQSLDHHHGAGKHGLPTCSSLGYPGEKNITHNISNINSIINIFVFI